VSGVDWTATWGVIGPAIIGLATWLKMRKLNQAKVDAAVSAARAEAVNSDATSEAVKLLRGEVERLGARVLAMEGREGRMIRHIYRLEGLMRAANPPIDPPPFDLDGEPVKAGGTT